MAKISLLAAPKSWDEEVGFIKSSAFDVAIWAANIKKYQSGLITAEELIELHSSYVASVAVTTMRLHVEGVIDLNELDNMEFN